MSVKEFKMWMAHEMLNNEDYTKRISKEIDKEKVLTMTDDEKNKSVIDFFKSITGDL